MHRQSIITLMLIVCMFAAPESQADTVSLSSGMTAEDLSSILGKIGLVMVVAYSFRVILKQLR